MTPLVHVYWAKTRAGEASAASRALLPAVVATHSGTPADRVVITRDCPDCERQHGKPQVPGTPWHVSATNTPEYLAVAITTAGPVGVDLELVDAVDFAGFDDVALSPDQAAAIAALPESQRPAARARYWVRKEAYLKATGSGLRTDPRTTLADTAVDIVLTDGLAAAVCLLSGDQPRIEIKTADDLLAAWAASPRTATA